MAKNCLIYETLNDVKTMQVEKKDDGFMHLSGVFGVCGVRNNNHRIYEAKNYKMMVDEMKKRIKEEGCPGELEHPNSMNITTENISHKIDSIEIDENGVVTGEITLLNTPKGKIAQEIVKGGLPLYISSRAQGNVDKDGNVTLESLKTYDLVGSPGFSQAKLHLNESQICESLSDTCFIIESADDVNDSDPTYKDDVHKVWKQYNESAEESTEENTEENTEINENNTDWDMVQLEDALNRINELENEVQMLRESQQNIDVEKFCNAIEQWIVEEYSPEIQNWVVEEYSPEIQNWVVEEYSPEVQNWICEEYTHKLSDTVQQWVVEEYSPEVQNWVIEEYSPEVQNWICEDFAGEVTNWISEDVLPDSKSTSLEDIKDTLSMMESLEPQAKPVYKRVTESDEPKFIAEMPEDARVKWNMASEEVKESIKRRAKIYNFVNEGAVESFWNSVNWEAAPVKTITEGIDNIMDPWERNIRMGFRARRK